MFERILEPEVMDTWEDAVEYDAMDFAEANTAFADRAFELGPPSGRVLDLGTGTARIPILLLQRNPKLIVEAVDFSLNMLRMGRQNLHKAGMEGQINLRHADAKNLPFSGGSFDFVMSNSLAHHLADPLALLREIKRAAKRGAGILIRDLVRPRSSKEFSQLVERHTEGCDDRQKKLFSDSLHAALSMEEVHLMLRTAGFEDLRLNQPSDRHWSAERAWRRI